MKRLRVVTLIDVNKHNRHYAQKIIVVSIGYLCPKTEKILIGDPPPPGSQIKIRFPMREPGGANAVVHSHLYNLVIFSFMNFCTTTCINI